MSLRAPQYLSRFRCLAERCPDTCCAGLVVELTPLDLQRLETTIGAQPEGGAELATAISRDEEGAPVLQGAAGRCGFLQPDLRCSVIRRFGEEAVPDPCALYPRELSQFAERTEVWATLACPEAARLCLTGDDPLQVVEVGPELASRRPRGALPGEGRPYVDRLEEVLELGSGVLRDASHRLAVRLGRLALFAERVEPFFSRASEGRESASWSEATAWLASSSSATEAASWLEQQPAEEEARAHAEVFDMLARLQSGASPRYLEVLDAAWASFEQSGSRVRARAERGRAITQQLGAPIDSLLSRYAVNEWHRVWFTRSPSLLSHLFKLTLRVAGIRTLLLGQPLLASGAPVEREELERCAIEVVQRFSRRFDSRSTLGDSLDEALSEEALGMQGAVRIRAFAAH